MKIAIVVSHPIQHFCPQYVSIAKHAEADLKVFFASALGYKKYMDPNFKREVSWGNLHLDLFDHVFMNGEVVIPSDKNIDASSLETHLTDFGPEVVILYGYYQKLQRRAHRWARRNGVPLAYISDSELRHRRNRVKEFLKSFFLRRYFKGIAYFLSVGDANEAFYKHYGVTPNRIIRMHFPIDIQTYRAAYRQADQLRRQVRELHGIGENDFVIAVAGKLVPWKNQDHIIDALQLLEHEGLALHCFILGSGELLTAWKAKASVLKKSNVHFTGFVEITELPGYYAAADVYVHPASIEPHSIAVSEAIYMGCPVIISNTSGSYGESDDVQIGINGYVYPFGNIPELASNLRTLVNNSSLRKEFGKASHRLSEAFQKRSHGFVIDDLICRVNDDKKKL